MRVLYTHWCRGSLYFALAPSVDLRSSAAQGHKKLIHLLLRPCRHCHCLHFSHEALNVSKIRVHRLNILIFLHKYFERLSSTSCIPTTGSLSSASSMSDSSRPARAALCSASSSSESDSTGASVHSSVGSSTTSSTRRAEPFAFPPKGLLIQ